MLIKAPMHRRRPRRSHSHRAALWRGEVFSRPKGASKRRAAELFWRPRMAFPTADWASSFWPFHVPVFGGHWGVTSHQPHGASYKYQPLCSSHKSPAPLLKSQVTSPSA